MLKQTPKDTLNNKDISYYSLLYNLWTNRWKGDAPCRMHWIWIVGWKPVLRGLQMDRPNWSYFCPKTKCRKNDTNSSSKSQSIEFRFLMFCFPCHVFIRIQLRNCKTVAALLPTHSTLQRQGATSVIKVRASLRDPVDRWRRLSTTRTGCNKNCVLLL